MNSDLTKAYAEVDKILSFMETQYVEKVPRKLREVFKNEKLKEYDPIIKKDILLNEQNLEKKTYAILAMLDINYWCTNEEEKQELISAYSNNDKNREKELRERYNPDNIFKNKTKEIEQEENTEEITSLVKYKEESFIKKLINRIKKFFKK